jgi:hypothetical protein
VPLKRDDGEERAARIDQMLEELRLNTEDMRELAKQAVNRARRAADEAKFGLTKGRARAGKKR